MKLKTLMIIDKIDRIELLKSKIANLQDYCIKEDHELELEIVMMGNAVTYFKDFDDSNDLLKLDADIALCNNALNMHEMERIQYQNLRTVVAGVGEVLVKKTEGWVDYLI